jgi:hypothetical protein
MRMKLKDKIIFAFLYIVMIAGFTFTLINEHKYATIQKDELTIVTEVFSESKNIQGDYKIICDSGKEYLLAYIIADDEHIEGIKPGDELILSIDKNRIFEFTVNGEVIISLEESNQIYNEHFKTLLVIFPSVIVGMILLSVGIHFLFKKIEQDYVEGNYKSNYVKINEVVDEKVYKSIQDSIYKKNGYLRCNILEQIESDELVYTFYKAMIDYLNDRELILLIDDGCTDDGLAMVFYKDGNKLYFNTIFREENKPFEIERSLFWYYPYDAKVTKEESEAFVDAVEEYITYNKDLLKFTDKQK